MKSYIVRNLPEPLPEIENVNLTTKTPNLFIKIADSVTKPLVTWRLDSIISEISEHKKPAMLKVLSKISEVYVYTHSCI